MMNVFLKDSMSHTHLSEYSLKLSSIYPLWYIFSAERRYIINPPFLFKKSHHLTSPHRIFMMYQFGLLLIIAVMLSPGNAFATTFGKPSTFGLPSVRPPTAVRAAPKIIISGAPASGKGTQCAGIVSAFGCIHLSTGDMLRAAVAAGTPVGMQAKEYMDSGKLVPDEVIINLIQDRMSEDDCKNCGWLLDGFPRTKVQADALKAGGVKADCFIFLNVPDEELVKRVCGRRTDPVTGQIYHTEYNPPPVGEIADRVTQRSDDTEEKVKVRLAAFHDNVAAVKGEFKDISVEIDGTQKPDIVGAAIKDALDTRLWK